MSERLDEIAQRGFWRDGSDEARLWRSDVEYLLERLRQVERLASAAREMLKLENRRMYEHDFDADVPGPQHVCPCPGCVELRAALHGWDSEK